MTVNDLSFPAGTHLTVSRETETYSPLGDRATAVDIGTIGPCSIVDTHGTYQNDENGRGAWVGSVDVQGPPNGDVKAGDHITLPSGEVGIVTKPPERPVNPFTGWSPFIQFNLATPGKKPARQPGDNPLG